jgi:hypothetical protein
MDGAETDLAVVGVVKQRTCIRGARLVQRASNSRGLFRRKMKMHPCICLQAGAEMKMSAAT